MAIETAPPAPSPGRDRRRRRLLTALLTLPLVAGVAGPAVAAPAPPPLPPPRAAAPPPSPGPPRSWAAPDQPVASPGTGGLALRPPPLGYRVTALRTARGQAFTPSMAGNPINLAGQVAGTTVAGNGSSPPQAAVFDLGSLSVRVLHPPGSDSASAYDVNDHGDVSGTAEYLGRSEAFVWTRSTDTYRFLGTLGGARSLAFALNDEGVVVGRSARRDRSEHAFIVDPAVDGGRMRDLGTLPGEDVSGATGLNDRGDVVGWSAGDQQPSHAVRWRPASGAVTDLGRLPWANGAYALGINDRGFVVGASGFDPPVGEPNLYRPGRAFLVNPLTGQLRELAGGEDGADTVAAAINVHGLIVGSSWGQTQRVLLWNSCGTPVQELARGGSFSYGVGINRYERVLGGLDSTAAVWRRNGDCG